MRRRALGKTGLVVSALGVGTFGLSGDGYGPVEPEAAKLTLQRAEAIGITLFETADAYGGGKMEALFGELFSNRDDLVRVTKIGVDRSTDPGRRRFDREFLEGAIERSRLRQKRDALDVCLLHNPSLEALEEKGALYTLLEAKQRGHLRHVGLSTSQSDIARRGLELGAEIVSLPYNLMHVHELNRLAGDILIHRPGVLTHSPLAYGLLSDTWNEERSFDYHDHRSIRWNPEDIAQRKRQLEQLRFLIRGSVPSARGAALRFALSNDLISSVLCGPKSVEQLEQLVRDTGDGPVYLAESDLREVYRVLDKLGVPV